MVKFHNRTVAALATPAKIKAYRVVVDVRTFCEPHVAICFKYLRQMFVAIDLLKKKAKAFTWGIGQQCKCF